MNRLVDFLINNHYKNITILARVYSAYYRFRILHTPMEKLQKKIGIMGEEASQEVTEEQAKIIRVISLKVNGICSKTKWESKCFVRALTAQKLLKSYKIPSTLYMGVRTEDDTMKAHAWIISGGRVVTGANGGEYRLYTVVSKFRA